MKINGKSVMFFLILLSAVFSVLWLVLFSQSVSYYIIAAFILLLFILPFFVGFEKSPHSAREMALLAVLTALAVASRAVFYLVPQFKPIAAVVIASAVCLGAGRGCLIGALSAFISNFLFGQGLWTPFQMVALGVIGFTAGLIFERVKTNRMNLTVIGFLLTFVVYGLIVDLSSVFLMVSDFSISAVLAVYLSGAPFNAAFAGATAVLLFLFGEIFIKKLDRINNKYGIVVRNPLSEEENGK